MTDLESSTGASGDQELAAMGTLSRVLDGLGPDARIRVLIWATSRYGGDLGSATAGSTRVAGQSVGHGGHSTYESFVDLFHAANARTDAERALIAGYWLQVLGGEGAVKAQDINNELKNLGHGLSNVTDALGTLQARRPAQVRQVAKSGRARQARKSYRLTSEGIATVEQMLGLGAQS